jgi:hypothetical protein
MGPSATILSNRTAELFPRARALRVSSDSVTMTIEEAAASITGRIARGCIFKRRLQYSKKIALLENVNW